MDREKVISWLEGLAEADWRECYSDSEVQETARQALNLIDELLKEQEETTFVYDEYTLPTCEKCTFHPFAGYIPTIKWMKERGYMKCPRCGRTINWNG